MPLTVTKGKTDFFFEHKSVEIAYDTFLQLAIEGLRSSLIAKLVSYGDVYFCRADDSITIVKQGNAYRGIYVDFFQVTGYTQTKHHPTGAPRDQYNAVWMTVEYSEYFLSIPLQPGDKFEDREATIVPKQMTQLNTAVHAYFAAGHVPPGTLPTGSGSSHPHLPLYPEIAHLEPFDGVLEEVQKQYKAFIEIGASSH